MAKYIKDGVIYDSVKQLKYNGKLYINPTESIILAAGYAVYTEPEKSDAEKLSEAISEKIDVIERYGNRDDHNSYIAMGVTIRLTTELRLRLRNVINAKISAGATSMTEWYNGNSYTYPITAWDKQLTAYENFLYEVSCVTEQHKSNLRACTTIEEVNEYDYTTGYPDILNFDVDSRTDEEKLADAITAKLSALSTYVDSDEINCYIAMGVSIRLSLDLRTRLRNVIDSKIALGETTLTEYYDGHSYTYPLTAWDKQLSQYENYLYEVYLVAQQHKANIQALTSLDDVNDYDYTTGYPTPLNFDVDTRTDEEKLADAKTAKISALATYADSDELNSYIAGGISIRLSFELRTRLRNVINSKIALGETTLTELYDGHSYVYPLTVWDLQLSMYENYLYEVSCTAEHHKAAINNLTTIDEVNDYDYTTGYPEALNFDLMNADSESETTEE